MKTFKQEILDKVKEAQDLSAKLKAAKMEEKESPLHNDFLGNVYRIILFGVGHYQNSRVYGATIREITKILDADKDKVRWAVWKLSKSGYIKDTSIKRQFRLGEGGKMIVWTATDKLKETIADKLEGSKYDSGEI